MEILAALFLAVCLFYPWTVGLVTLGNRWLNRRPKRKLIPKDACLHTNMKPYNTFCPDCGYDQTEMYP